MVELFRRRGLKVTPQRELIFELRWGAGHHPTADSVYAEARDRMPTMSLRTVYQTLNDLAAMGELQQLDLGTGSTRFDPNTDVHHHLVCTSLDDFEEVPDARSRASTRAVERPRLTASRATPQPVTPPPTTRTSNSSPARRSSDLRRSNSATATAAKVTDG